MMRLFICEFITGGGLQDQELPDNLVKEGSMMLEALLVDLLDMGITDISITRDKRLDPVPLPTKQIVIEGDAYGTWQSCMDDAEAVWIIAPESDGALFRLTLMAEQSDCLVLGSTSSAVKSASSKILTAKLLDENNITSIETNYLRGNKLAYSENGWVIKPDDGVGSEDCYYCKNNESLDELTTSINIQNFVVQKYLPGIPASMSMICFQGKAQLLACNQQIFIFENNKGCLKGIIVNGLLDRWQEFNTLAQKIAKADEGLMGYVGVDLIVTESEAVVVEINPRMTTSYVGLRESLSLNPAELICSIWQNSSMSAINEKTFSPVSLSLD